MKIIPLTKSTWPVIGWIATLLGLIMSWIFTGLNAAGIPSVAFAIIIFTIVVNIAMTPMTAKQQRSSRMQSLLQPEIKKVQDKYRGKKDQVSQQKLMEETQAVYRKYGVSMTGSCLPMLIQFPVLFAIYQVIYHIPGYISIIGNKLTHMVEQNGFAECLQDFVANAGSNQLTATLTNSPTTKTMVDVLYRLNSNQWNGLLEKASGASFTTELSNTHEYMSKVLSFLKLNIADSPWNIISQAMSDKSYLLIIAAIAFPVLAWLTQVLNTKMMPQPSTGDDGSALGGSLRSMNLIMPVMSAVFCFTLPVGVGIYWIVGAVVRTVQMYFINKRLDKEDLSEIIAKNQEKAAQKAEKKGATRAQIAQNSARNTRNIDSLQKTSKQVEIEKRLQAADEAAERRAAKPADGSIASRANLVQNYNDKHGKTRKHSDAKKK